MEDLSTTQPTSKRDDYIYMVQILDQTDRHQDMVDLMKKVIDLNPELNNNERNLLSVSYKNIITVRRSGLRVLGVLEQDENSENNNRLPKLQAFKSTLIEELDKYCYELINLVDTKLLPAAKTPEAQLFYEKLKADYYRYICEAKEGDEKKESAAKAKECYERALEIAKDQIQPFKPSYLGLILNYSVYLYEIAEQKDKAIELAKTTKDEVENTIDQNTDDESFTEANTILNLLLENVELWLKNNQ